MKATWEKLEKNEGLLRIEVDEQKVAQALDQAFKKVVQKINVPGFRKGKVPRGIFEARFGVESLYQDALDIILPEVYGQALNETGVEPIDRPEIDVEQFEKGSPLKFSAKVQVKPEVTLGAYKGLEVEEKSFEVTDEEVDGEITTMQQRHAELTVLDESQAAESGDTVILDFEGFVDGEAFEGGKAEKYSLELGSNSFIPGFEEQLIGVVKDEDKDVNVTFPEEYHAENLKGKEAVFKVHIHEIKRKNLPELDDEFAKDVSEFETLSEYRDDVKKNIAERKENERKQYIENTVIDQAVEAAEVEIPEVMITTEVDQMIQDFAGRLRMQGMDMELYFQYSGQNEEALREQMKDDAQRRVRTNLVLQAIAQAEGIEAGEEELQAEYERMADMYKKTADEIRQILDANGSVADVKRDLASRKVIDLLIEQSQTKAVEA